MVIKPTLTGNRQLVIGLPPSGCAVGTTTSLSNSRKHQVAKTPLCNTREVLDYRATFTIQDVDHSYTKEKSLSNQVLCYGTCNIWKRAQVN